ncbi:MAG: FG-GAP-like repeat-containing protein [Methanosarcinales archaeon]|jgi:RHS repeat-associated protein|nr:FG-GAP-like repeat-containing protein [Methanosarcinales archaeon]
MKFKQKLALIFCFMILISVSVAPMAFASESGEKQILETSSNNQNNDFDQSNVNNEELEFEKTNSKSLENIDLEKQEFKNTDLEDTDNESNMQLSALSAGSSSPSINLNDLTSVSGPDMTYSGDKTLSNLFTGAFEYAYEFNTPDGVSGFQPSVFLSYNSHFANGPYGWTGNGWFLNENRIERKVNYTPANVSDDTFVLILNGAAYDLIYNATENRYHTETETYLNIMKESGGNNQKGEYWIVKSKDGTTYRFGYNPNSELLNSLSGRNYVLRWSLDQAKDVNNNTIDYNYVENPTSGEISATYLNSISYNNGSATINFSRANKTAVFDLYKEGGRYKEMNLLSGISMYVNSELVRKYDLNYRNQSNQTVLESIVPFSYDNTSFYKTNFTYSKFHNSSSRRQLPTPIYRNNTYSGVVLIDVNGDSRPDVVQNTKNPNINKTWINTKNGFTLNESWNLPAETLNNSKDTGVRFADLNGDGLTDIIQNSVNPSINNTWINTGNGFELNDTWRIPVSVVNNSVSQGVHIIDINGDNLPDIVQNTLSPTINNTWINTGSGFNLDNAWRIPVPTLNRSNDTGVRFVDLNSDGLVDIVQNLLNPAVNKTWINNGIGFVLENQWKTPVPFVKNYIDQNVMFIDGNNDGLADIVCGTNVYRNTGNGFLSGGVPISLFVPNNQTLVSDLNGDSVAVLIQTTDIPMTKLKDVTQTYQYEKPLLLTKVSHLTGGQTTINYHSAAEFESLQYNNISKIPVPLWIVSSLKFEPIAGQGSPFQTSYTYSNGLYHIEPRGESKFLGFGLVSMKTSQSYSEHHFYQDEWKKGIEYNTTVFSSDKMKRFQTVLNDYVTEEKNGTYVVALNSTQGQCYDGALNPVISQTFYKYDDYGNVIEILENGNNDLAGDERKTVFSYVYNTEKWILNCIKTKEVFNNQTEKVSQVTYSYDGDDEALPLKGLVTKIVFWNNLGDDPELSFEYDSFGNLISETDANGEMTTAMYSGETNYLYPEVISNAKGHNTKIDYDMKSGNIIKVTDPNNNSEEYVYDNHFRIKKIIKPYDSVKKPSIEYVYSPLSTDGRFIETIVKENNEKTIGAKKYFDGLGNCIKVETINNNGSVISQDTQYYQNGAVKEFTLPYTAGDEKLVLKYKYDALNRITEIQNTDGSKKEIVYGQLNTTFKDENSHKTKFNYDIYGNIIKVLEYNENEVYETNYEYDSLGRLIKILPHQNYDQSNILVPSGHIKIPYYLVDSNTALIQFNDLVPGDERVLYLSSERNGFLQDKSIFNFFEGFSEENDKWYYSNGSSLFKSSSENSEILKSNFIWYPEFDNPGPGDPDPQEPISSIAPLIGEDKNAIDGKAFAYDCMLSIVSNESVNLSEGFIFYLRSSNRGQFEPVNEQKDIGMIISYPEGDNYAGFSFKSRKVYPKLYGQEILSAPSNINGFEFNLCKIVKDNNTNQMQYFVNNNLVQTVDLDDEKHDECFVYINDAGYVSSEIDHIFISSYTPDVVKNQTEYNDSIRITVRNDGFEQLENATVEVDISQFGLSNESLSKQTLKFNVEPPKIVESGSLYRVQNTSYEYDSLGRQIRLDDPDLGVWTYEYDLNGNLIKQNDSRGIETRYEYDALNRLEKIDYLTDSDVFYEYDNETIGPLSKVLSEITSKEYRYDQRLRVINETISLDGSPYTTTYGYNSLDLLTNATYPNLKEATFEYDNRGLLKSIPGVIDNIEYDSSNLIKQKAYANGVITDLEYDNVTKRLKNLQTENLQNLSYSFDAGGNVVKIVDYELNETQEFYYDPLNRLVSASSESYAQNFVYNPIGNMLVFTNGDKVTLFKHGEGAGIHAPTKINNISLYYDENGNLIEDGEFTYTYDEANNLRTVLKKSDDNKIVAQYWYDENGQRVKKIEGGKTSYYVIDGYDVLDGEETIYYFANGERIAEETQDGKKWYLNDYLGSTNIVMNEEGEIDEKILYYPFGTQRSPDSLNSNSEEYLVENLIFDYDSAIENESNDSDESEVIIFLPGHIYYSRAAVFSDGNETTVSKYYSNVENMTYDDVLLDLTENFTNMSISQMMIIDLTDDFGTGNEPDASWCDQYLPHIEEMELLTYPMIESFVAQSKYTYTGKEFDKDIGLYYYGARYYNPTTFTFTQADNIIPNVYNPQSLNRYSYCLNNPITYTDPDGHTPLLLTAVIGAVAGALVAGIATAAIQYATTGEINKAEVISAAVGGAVAGGICGLTLGIGTALITTAGGASAIGPLATGTIMSVSGVTGETVGGVIGRGTESWVASDYTSVDKEYMGDPSQVIPDIIVGPTAMLTRPISGKLKDIPKDIIKETAEQTVSEAAKSGISNVINSVSSSKKSTTITTPGPSKPSTSSPSSSGGKTVSGSIDKTSSPNIIKQTAGGFKSFVDNKIAAPVKNSINNFKNKWGI